MPRPPEIHIADESQAAAEAASFVLEVGQEALRTKGRFVIVLAGGTTPESFYRALAYPAFANRFN